MSIFRLLHLFFFVCLFTSITGAQLKLYPTDLHVDTGDWATVNCRVPCELELSTSHTFRWFVGDNPERKVVSDFEQKTGIKVETQTITSCTDSSGYAYHELRVFASSAQRMNRTAIQCAAQRKSPSFSDYYSYFAVLLVKDELLTPTAPSTTEADEHYPNSTEANTDLPLITPTQCQTEKVTVTVTETVTVQEYKCAQ